MPSKNDIHKKRLIERYADNNASEKELQAFFGMLTAEEMDTALLDDMDREISRIQSKQLPQKKKLRLWIKVSAVAASVIGVFLIYYLIAGTHSVQTQDRFAKNDIAPGKNVATITTSDGQVINLSDSKTGVVVDADQLAYNDGSLVQHAKDVKLKNKMLTMRTPRGGQYVAVLSDGTRVWLNAASSIKFLSRFDGAERRVELEGEAYFEVAHSANQPFRVVSTGQVVEDIGTSFNINAYDDEPNIKTTLVEGSAKVNSMLLKPGQQAVFGPRQDIQLIGVDTEVITSWKDGFFSFKNTPIDVIMREISRWYDIEVNFESSPLRKITLSGSVSRYDKVSSILTVLEETGAIRFDIKGKKVIVLTNK